MTDSLPLISGDSTIGAWLAHPVGARIISGIAAQAGMDDRAVALMRNLPVARFLNAAGSAPDGLVDSLVEQVNTGRSATEGEEASGRGWTETISPGRFTGRTVIVTGAASGIGRAVASRAAREGGTIIAVDVSEQRLADFTASLPDTDLRGVTADITTEHGIDRIIAAAGGQVDALANVAGLLDDFSPIHEVSEPVLTRVFDVNVFGLIRLTKAAIPIMMQRSSGSIVNIASEAALRGSSAGLAYTASKHAVIGITKSTAFMYEQYGIRTNAVAPGGTLTGMRPGATSEFGKNRLDSHIADVPIALPEALAASITFLLSDDGVNVNGAVLPSDGGESVF